MEISKNTFCACIFHFPGPGVCYNMLIRHKPFLSGKPSASTRFAFIHSPEIEKYHYRTPVPLKRSVQALQRRFLFRAAPMLAATAPKSRRRGSPAREIARFHTLDYIEAPQARFVRGHRRIRTFLPAWAPQTPHFQRPVFLRRACRRRPRITAARLILDSWREHGLQSVGGYHHALCGQGGRVLLCQRRRARLHERLKRRVKKGSASTLTCTPATATQAAFYGDRARLFTVSLPNESGKTLFPWEAFEDEKAKATDAAQRERAAACRHPTTGPCTAGNVSRK